MMIAGHDGMGEDVLWQLGTDVGGSVPDCAPFKLHYPSFLIFHVIDFETVSNEHWGDYCF